MNPLICVADDFFLRPLVVREDILKGTFADYVSPEEGVVYPLINQTVPPELARLVKSKLEGIMGRGIVVHAIFTRATLAGTKPPNKVHCDRSMGKFAALVYMSLDWPAGTGTGFWRWKKDGSSMQTDKTDITGLDSNDPTQWEQLFLAQGKFNRVVIYDARLWHHASGGWGDAPKNGRIVLTCFYS